MKTALVLEGGGLRGIYSAGVIDTLLENNIDVDMVMGVSAGALFGVNYKSKQKGRVIRYNRKYLNDKRYMGFNSLIKTGNIMNKDFCFNKLVNELDLFDYNTFKNNKMKFYCVSTNVVSGKPEYFKLDDLENENEMEMLRSSGSLPCLSLKVKINDNYYLDGGISDPIPIKKVLEMGYSKVIVVSTRVKEYRKKPENTLISKLMYLKYSKFCDDLKMRYKIYNETLDFMNDLDDKNKIIVIRPSRLVNIGRLEKDVNVVNEMYDLGISDTKKMLKKIKAYLK